MPNSAQDSHEISNDPIAGFRWLELGAALAMLIGIAGLVALLSQGARAQTPPAHGFPPGKNTFSSPFSNAAGANPAAKSGNFFDDEDDDELDFPPPTPIGGAGEAPAVPGGFGAGGANTGKAGTGTGVGNLTINGNQITVGGTPAGGVISHSTVKPILVDDDTGDGSKEVVTDFNFPDADIMDIAKTLGKLTGKNFILDKEVKGRITIISNSPISVGDAWRAFLTALDINGFALIPSGKYIRIARARDARDKQLKAYTGEFAPDTDALITRVFPLKYISAEEVARTFRSFMPANSRVIPYEQTNTVIVTDTGSNISKLAKMLEILDVEGFDAGIETITVKYASAAEIAKLIDTLLPGTGQSTGAPGGARPGGFTGGGGGGRFTARRTKEGGIINTIIADERTNTLIVHANTKGADQVRELVAKLDQKLPSQTGGGKVHVRYLQYADAEQIATTLNNLSQASANKPTTGTGGGTGVNPVAQTLFEGAIKVSPDKATNALVITASPVDFVTVERVIDRLDIPRDEVYVEVVVMEVGVTREFDFATNVINPSSGIAFLPSQDLFNQLVNPAASTGMILSFASGSQRTLTINNQSITVSSIQGLIKAIQTNSNANVLATPQIIALDNTEASFESAEKIPVPTTTAIQGSVSTSISKENVSLSIKIKPQINKVSNFVKLDIDAKIEDISDQPPPPGVANLAFSTISRNAKTTVVVADTDTVVIGGLVRDKANDTVVKIPILGDIPLLGWLFRSHTSKAQKTNLLIFLTPHIVRQYELVRSILDKKLKERDDFIEKNAGGKDPLRDQRDEMIRALPDMKELMARKMETSVTIDEEKPAAVEVKQGNPFSGGKGRALDPDGKDAGGTPHSQAAPPSSGGENAGPVANPESAPGASGTGGQEALPVPPPAM